MTYSSLRSEIQNLLKSLNSSNIAPFVNQVVCRDLGSNRKRVTWAPEASGGLFKGDFTCISDYRRWIDENAYSAILYDGSILQMSYDFSNNEMIGHRLAYLPCPYDLDINFLVEMSLDEAICLYQDSGQAVVRLRSAIRFDWDSSVSNPNHPDVHVTLNSAHCRWAVVAPLSVGHFVRFVFKHFYPGFWEIHSFLRDWPQRLGDRSITASQEESLHIACSR
jgi:hypothetical protein